jgi:ATP-dependent exoDNAse (exonuclease V) beta subunit
MPSTQLTSSRIELASKCPGSQAHEHVQTTSNAAERGTAIHDYIAALLTCGEASLPSNHEARAVCEQLNADEILRAASPTAEMDYRVELGLYLSPDSGEAGILEGSHHRDYSGAPEGSIPGTADVVALEDDRVRVTDWKTGVRHESRLRGVVHMDPG